MTATTPDLFDRALTLHKQGQLDDALPLYRQALALGPETPDLLIGAGIAFSMKNDLQQAIEHLTRATELAPDNAIAFAHLGTMLNDAGRFREAIPALSRAAELDPNDAVALTNLGCSYRSLGRLDEALDCFTRAVRLDPTQPAIQSNLATTLAMHDQPAEAGLRLYSALVLSPDYADAYSNMGAVMLRGGLPHSEPAMLMLARAVQIDPDLPMAHSNLSVILAGRGEPDRAVPHNMRAAELAPNPENWSRVLFNLNYCDSWSAEDCATEHKRIGGLFDAAGAGRRLPPARPGEGRRHRLGFVSPDFRNHSVSYFLRPLLTAIDRGQFEVFCYSDVLKGDEVTAEIRASADHWIEAVGLSDVELAQRVRADQIDTLIDLAGHTPHNRMGAFALRPAPVQMTWLGYANTSGLTTIDYRIVDEITDPPGVADALASETLLRLPGGFLCYGPPPYAPDPAVRPPAIGGAVIFGTFNNPTKITDATFDLWSRLLNRLPSAKLLIKSFRLRDEVLRLHIVDKFARNGVAGDRLILLDANADAAEHLATYGEVDIGLDPVLYNGTTTTFEALWMGVPVIAERGDRHAGRVGASLLTHIGLPDLIAENADHYVEIACRLAENPAELARLRTGLRQRLATSPLCDAAGFARKFEAALKRAAASVAAEPAVGAFERLKAAIGQTPLDLAAVAAARDTLVSAVRADLAAIPSIDALLPVCRDLSLLGLRRSAPPPPANAALADVLAHCLTAPPFTLTALPALDTLPPPALAILAALLLEGPVCWNAPGEPDRYAVHVEAVLSAANKGLQAQAQDPAASDAALLVAATCRLGPAMASEHPLTRAARDRAGLIELWLAGLGLSLDHEFTAKKRQIPRLGLFRSHWEPSAESGPMLSYLEDLKRDGEIIVYAIHPFGDSDFERRVRALADRVALLPDSIADAVTALRQDDLDLLLIGHDVTTHLSLPTALAACRVARRQAVTAASPVVPGFARLDDWLGADAMPPREWIPEGPLPVSLTREELGIPADRLVLVSAAPLIRLTAEVMARWGALLKKRQDAHLVLYPFDQSWTSHPALATTEAGLRALLEIGPADQARVTILPPGVSKAGARAVLALADLYLDAFPSADPADLLDPLSVGLPLQLSRGSQPRSRRLGEIHDLYRLPALVAETPEEYETMASSLAASPAERASLRDDAAACRMRLDDRGTLISWRSFPSRVATSDTKSGPILD
jgi:predicted O-linked N-acetylglucosamine transferase (SPINDLY family)